MASFDLLENCSHPIFDEKPARLVSIAFARASQSARIAMVQKYGYRTLIEIRAACGEYHRLRLEL